ncbi:DASH family cryptochrome [Haliscomenobacter sp.]|uniref:DASH family cryptochrome n=1 Tax=Haliscomenobacter sp. TaxID=2717303 RepID=UPI003BAD1977
MRRRAIVWFRQDLRLHDNEALQDALRNVYEVIPVFVFDERVFKRQTNFGFPKTGKYRTKFILESVADLRQSLRRLNCELIVRVGKPEEVLFELAKEYKTSWIFCNRERTAEELKVQDTLEQKLWSIGQEMRYNRGKMLYYTADLPFPVQHTPDVFTQFRKEVERIVPVREPLTKPDKTFNPWSVEVAPGEIPTLADFGHEDFELDSRAVLSFKGGETEGLKRLNYYLWESNLIKDYKETRNGLLGGDYSSKFSPWLAQGCLSPKMVYHELKRYEAARGANESTYWLFFELLWRDFFRFMAKKHGSKIFQIGGTRGVADPKWKNDPETLQAWIDGKTGIPFVDANMLELKHTGFMSNRGRQNVASYLVKDLGVNWQMGAEYFESVLIDYDVCSNWGNWNYVAGVGSDPREDRYFNMETQAKRYDPNGDYVRHWLPELAYSPV